MQQSRVVQEKIMDLKRLQTALNEMVAHCKGDQYSIDDCPIVDALFTKSSDGILSEI